MVRFFRFLKIECVELSLYYRDSYESLFPRIIKHYSYPLMQYNPSLKISEVTSYFDVYFSSSPALLTSVDDFYTVKGHSELGVIETSNSVYNVTLLSYVTYDKMLSWMRVLVSNSFAKSGTLDF